MDMSHIRNELMDVSRAEIPNLREAVEEQYRYVLDGKLSSDNMTLPNPSDVLNVVANPFELNEMFHHLPRAIVYPR